MALGFLAIALFLFLGLDSDYGYASSASAVSSEGVEITYGTVLNLMQERTKFRLHSHDVPYGSGSGQQSVAGFPNVDDANSYWNTVLTMDIKMFLICGLLDPSWGHLLNQVTV
ncbi:Stromal cell-derived factor 2-like protein [Morella rubra]|uniref:Stromal cell-derived factor 2-like protein n=1 Tax=Morella rubra TaxID=262757 RepID=A0A6A1V389_9ROSI|nr:Stromal cell-derived factor 2-like protein [Morella rubra]